jgi:hypothetical protein
MPRQQSITGQIQGVLSADKPLLGRSCHDFSVNDQSR